MNLRAILVFLAVQIAATTAASIAYDAVAAIPQPEAVTISEKAGVKFKPQTSSKGECTCYPAVNAAGDTSRGLPKAPLEEVGGNVCKVAPATSQVYGRATWYKDVWAILYAWYYPRDSLTLWPPTHNWQNAVVWIDNPVLASSKILGLSMSKSSQDEYLGESNTTAPLKQVIAYTKVKAPIENLDGTSVKLQTSNPFSPMVLSLTEEPGEFQDLIMWDQLPEVARVALNGTAMGVVPINDANFQGMIEAAWPF